MSGQPTGIGRTLLFEVDESGVALVTLNRPDKRNAINAEMAEALAYIVRYSESDDNIRVVVLRSCENGTFCAGADLAEIAAGRGQALAPADGGFAGLADARRDKPWIAMVGGNALAGGCELVLACDMIVASVEARFGVPEVKRGLLAGAGGVHRLGRALPRNIALELVATGDPLSADRAYQLGLVNRLVPSSELLREALALAHQIAANAPLSVRESLRIARLSQERPDAELRAMSTTASQFIGTTADAMEGARAFLERRTPKWVGR